MNLTPLLEVNLTPFSRAKMNAITLFVCGTYADLSEERGKVLDILSKLQVSARSMELFGARPQQPIEVCLDELRRSNLVLVIVGNRYGARVPGRELSFSEAEYIEARRLGIPCLVYFRNGASATNPGNASDEDALRRWKSEMATSHTPAYFIDANDLALRVAIDVPKIVSSPLFSPAKKVFQIPEDASIGQPSVKVALKFGDSERQLLHGLALDSSGNILMAGDFWGGIKFGEVATTLTSRGDRDIFLAKFDPEGRHLWSQSFGDIHEQCGIDVVVDSMDNIFIVSAFAGELSFGGSSLVSKGKYNIAVAKLGPDGSHIWSRSYGDKQYHVAECLAPCPDGGVVLAGRFSGGIDFGLGLIESVSEQTDIILASIASDGTCRWARRHGGRREQQTRSVATGPDGAIALVGVFKEEICFDEATLVAQNSTDYAGFLAVTDSAGNLRWLKSFGDPAVEQGSVVAFDGRNGDIVVAGFIRNGLPVSSSGVARSMCTIARYDTEGVLRWSRTFGAVAFPSCLRIDQHGRTLLTGYFQGALDFDGSPIRSAGGFDIFVAVFSANGSLEWSARYGDRHHQFLVKGDFGMRNSVVLSGSFHGTIDFGTGPLEASGLNGSDESAEDVFLAILE